MSVIRVGIIDAEKVGSNEMTYEFDGYAVGTVDGKVVVIVEVTLEGDNDGCSVGEKVEAIVGVEALKRLTVGRLLGLRHNGVVLGGFMDCWEGILLGCSLVGWLEGSLLG